MLYFNMPGILQQYLKQCWKATLDITLYCRKLFCCTSTEFAELTSLCEMDSIERHPVEVPPHPRFTLLFIITSTMLTYHWQFDKRYHDYQFDEAQVPYPDSEDPKIELIFRKAEERAKTARSLKHDKNLRIVNTGLGYLNELDVPMVELGVEFYHWKFQVDVPRVSLKGYRDFKPSKMLS